MIQHLKKFWYWYAIAILAIIVIWKWSYIKGLFAGAGATQRAFKECNCGGRKATCSPTQDCTECCNQLAN